MAIESIQALRRNVGERELVTNYVRRSWTLIYAVAPDGASAHLCNI